MLIQCVYVYARVVPMRPAVADPRFSQRLQEVFKSTPDQVLRVKVDPGGCSGFQYVFTIEDSAQSDDMYGILSPSFGTCITESMSRVLPGVYFRDSNRTAGVACPPAVHVDVL